MDISLETPIVDPCVTSILALEDSKSYTLFANPILKSLLLAVREGLISHKAALTWLMLKSEAQVSDRKQWSLKKSIREMSHSFGFSKNSAQKVCNELEQGGFIEIDRSQRNDLRTEANTIKIRFPATGIELAQLEKDRAKSSAPRPLATHLSTEVGQKSGHACPQKGDSIKNRTINKKLLHNNSDSLSTKQGMHPHSSVDCCLASPEKKKHDEVTQELAISQDPALEAKEALKSRISKLQDRSGELTTIRQADHRNSKAYLDWLDVDSKLNAAKIELECLENSTFKAKKAVPHISEQKPEPSKNQTVLREQGRGLKRSAPVELEDALLKKIERKGKHLAKKKLWSEPHELVEQVKFMVKNFGLGESPEHCANICFKLIEQDKFQTPGGYQNNSLLLRDVDHKNLTRAKNNQHMMRFTPEYECSH